jgi:hypothetical protein
MGEDQFRIWLFVMLAQIAMKHDAGRPNCSWSSSAPKIRVQKNTPIDEGYHAHTATCRGCSPWLFRRANLTQSNGLNDKR